MRPLFISIPLELGNSAFLLKVLESFSLSLFSSLTPLIIYPCHFEEASLSTISSILRGSMKSTILLLPLHRNIALTLNVTAGEYDLNHTEPGEQTLTIETIIVHPHFSTKKPMDYDIALLKMTGAFNFGKHLRPTLNCLSHVLHNFCSIAHSLQYILCSICPTVLGHGL